MRRNDLSNKPRSILPFAVLLAVLWASFAANALQTQVVDRGETSITIRWDAAPSGFQGYFKVWREVVDASGTASDRTVAYTSSDLSQTTYTDLSLQSGTRYRYSVELYDASDALAWRAPALDACTQQRVSAINWGYVGGGILIIVLLIVFLALGGGAIAGNPAGIAALVGFFILGFGLIAFGVSATSLIAPC